MRLLCPIFTNELRFITWELLYLYIHNQRPVFPFSEKAVCSIVCSFQGVVRSVWSEESARHWPGWQMWCGGPVVFTLIIWSEWKKKKRVEVGFPPAIHNLSWLGEAVIVMGGFCFVSFSPRPCQRTCLFHTKYKYWDSQELILGVIFVWKKDLEYKKLR